MATLTCGCGKEVTTSRALTMHQTSKAHRTWENGGTEPETSGVAVATAPAMDETLMAALAEARAGADPRNVAKMVRSVFNRMDWPNSDHQGTVVDWLREHNIPILDIPPHLDPDEHRQHTARQFQEWKSEGYGTERWDIR